MGKVRCLSFYRFRYQTLLGTIFLHFYFCTASVHIPATVKIGAVLCFNSTMGTVAKNAIELAVQAINKDSSLLNSTTLVVEMVDGDDIVKDAVTAMGKLNGDVVAVIRSQSCMASCFRDKLAFDSEVPSISFTATGITIPGLQHPNVSHIPDDGDTIHMTAIASLIGYQGWTNVAVLYIEDGFRGNEISFLCNALAFMEISLVQKTALPSGTDKDTVADILMHLVKRELKVFVIHTEQDMGLLILKVAYYMGMIGSDYVWIITDAFAGMLDPNNLDLDALNSIQGIIAVQRHIPQLPWLRNFLTEMNRLEQEEISMTWLNSYASYAHDSVWMIAHAIESYLRQNQSIEFNGLPLRKAGGTSERVQENIFRGGILCQHILHTKFNGTTGIVQLDGKGGLAGSVFEFLHMAVDEVQVLGYWTNKTGIFASPSQDVVGTLPIFKPTSPKQLLQRKDWKEGSNQLFTGRKLQETSRHLKVGIPKKTGFQKFVEWSEGAGAHGFCVEVFKHALHYIPYRVDTEFDPFGNGSSTPTYDDMVQRLANKEFDALVGDFTLLASRMDLIDFTQPYIESGIAVLVPVKSDNSANEWAFLRPFTPAMWCTTGAFFAFTGIVLWVLEHKKNPDFQGRPTKQIVTILWSIFSTLFFSQREDIRSILGRFVTIIWLFVVLIITSSYTANLTSILTVQKLSPTIQGIDALQRSKGSIGYQEGSFVKQYLLSLNFPEDRLYPLNTIEEYKMALELGADKPGGVVAIVDEMPYLKMFLSYECGFMIAGQEIIRAGWGFGFQKGSGLAREFSKAILRLYENGQLQKLQDTWLNEVQCNDGMQSSQLGLKSFEGLFLLSGLASSTCLIIYIMRLLWYFTPRFKKSSSYGMEDNSLSSRGFKFVKSFALYINEPGAYHTDDQCQREMQMEGRIVPDSDSTSADGSRNKKEDDISV